MQISSLLAGKKVQTIDPDATIEVLSQALSVLKIGALVVSNNGKKIMGIVSERDIVQALAIHIHDIDKIYVRDIMTVNVMTCTKDSTIAELMALMTDKRIRHVPVVDVEGELLSIISIGDVVKSYVSEIDLERSALINYVNSAG
ncbi:MAG: CBS domain-containing protein [Actinomycetota bacterium]|tara:strand:- start:9002 stop:9433 length:432 start_codon:yes stop_codon:yes gene_type:complete